MNGEKGKHWPAIISTLLVIGIAVLGWNVSLIKDLGERMDKINNNFMEHRLDYAQHKTATQKDIEALQKKE